MSLPPFAPFPEAVWRERIVPVEWEACLDAWILLAESHLSLGSIESISISARDNSLHAFLASYMSEAALIADAVTFGEVLNLKRLRKLCFLLASRLLVLDPPPDRLMKWEFLSDFGKVYGKVYSSRLVAGLWTGLHETLQNSLADTKTYLTKELDRGINGEQVELERRLKRLNQLLYCSPETATFFMNGSDFLDGLISCYKAMNHSLRKSIICTAYLCLIGLTEGPNPKTSLLTDQLYSLNTAAETHKTGPTNIKNSLVAELVTMTPILRQILHRVENSRPGYGRLKSVIAALEVFRNLGGGKRNSLVRGKGGKGKAAAVDNHQYSYNANTEEHLHRMSLVSQVQDLFPNLGAQIVSKLLEEHEDDVEQVISHLLEGSLPLQLNEEAQLDAMNPGNHTSTQSLETRSTPPMIPTRRNVFDDDEFDQLVVGTSRLHFGRRNPETTADDILKDRSTAPKKGAILSALAAFDSDDDERDDTYDVEDVGGTVDSATPGNNPEEANAEADNGNDEALFQAYKMTRSVFNRDTQTRRGAPRRALKEETGMTDEAIEGWALMLSRDPRRLHQLEANFSSFSGAQIELASTGWRADAGDLGIEASGGAGRGGRERGGRGVRGNVAGPAGTRETEMARHRKEANKGSRANHNRRDQRAKKMARGGF